MERCVCILFCPAPSIDNLCVRAFCTFYNDMMKQREAANLHVVEDLSAFFTADICHCELVTSLLFIPELKFKGTVL